MIGGMSTGYESPGLYARYAEECLELGVLPLPPDDLIALLAGLLATGVGASMPDPAWGPGTDEPAQ